MEKSFQISILLLWLKYHELVRRNGDKLSPVTIKSQRFEILITFDKKFCVHGLSFRGQKINPRKNVKTISLIKWLAVTW